MVAHAVRGVPWEACGLIAGPPDSDEGLRFFPVANAAESETRYRLDPQQMLDAEAQIHDAGLAVVGVMHSHPRTSAYPSPTDTTAADDFDPRGRLFFVIVSLKRAEPALRSFKIHQGAIREIPVEVFSTSS